MKGHPMILSVTLIGLASLVLRVDSLFFNPTTTRVSPCPVPTGVRGNITVAQDKDLNTIWYNITDSLLLAQRDIDAQKVAGCSDTNYYNIKITTADGKTIMYQANTRNRVGQIAIGTYQQRILSPNTIYMITVTVVGNPSGKGSLTDSIFTVFKTYSSIEGAVFTMWPGVKRDFDLTIRWCPADKWPKWLSDNRPYVSMLFYQGAPTTRLTNCNDMELQLNLYDTDVQDVWLTNCRYLNGCANATSFAFARFDRTDTNPGGVGNCQTYFDIGTYNAISRNLPPVTSVDFTITTSSFSVGSKSQDFAITINDNAIGGRQGTWNCYISITDKNNNILLTTTAGQGASGKQITLYSPTLRSVAGPYYAAVLVKNSLGDKSPIVYSKPLTIPEWFTSTTTASVAA